MCSLLPKSDVIIAPEQDAIICWKGVMSPGGPGELFWQLILKPAIERKSTDESAFTNFINLSLQWVTAMCQNRTLP